MRLIDADRLKRQVEGRSWRAKGKMIELIDDSPTIRVGENTCKHRTPDGLCRLHTDDEVVWFCVDGPCPNEEPITEVEPVKHGRWIVSLFPGSEHVSCSECGAEYYEDDLLLGGNEFPRYCPNCGAEMEGR